MKIGYNGFALFKLKFSEDSLAKGIEALSLMPDFNFIYKISGNYDCLASLMVRDVEQFTTVQEKIVRMENLTNMEVSLLKLFNAWPFQREFISTF
jgi:DNA-binding Lrp family transcriptional regulator